MRGLSNFRLSIIAACILVLWNTAYAAPCARWRAERKAWVATKVDALVRAARAAYESDKALPAYERVLDGITDSIRQCKLSEDTDFTGRYQVFLDYLEAASLDRDPDHELGLIVSDKQYFAETRKYVQIPEFLMNQSRHTEVLAFERSIESYCQRESGWPNVRDQKTKT